ncbi:MAG: RNA polymerase sigma factor [Saprospiraceae bacterium]|nr:RNA polymerase sigma factor [Saprospiraceae bacterium]
MTANEYNECVNAYADGLYRFAVSLLSDMVEAEDVVQQVFERFWKRHSEVQYEAAKTYLFTSVNRACIDYFRRKKTSRNTAELLPEHDSGTSGHNYEAQQLVQEMLSRLTEDQKQLVLLRDYEGYSYKEIAEIMQITEGQVKTNLFRTRKKLQFFLTTSTV